MGICCMSQGTQGLWINLEGWDGEEDGREALEWGDTCTPMADSCWGLTENSKIVRDNYPSKNKLKRTKNFNESESITVRFIIKVSKNTSLMFTSSEH